MLYPVPIRQKVPLSTIHSGIVLFAVIPIFQGMAIYRSGTQCVPYSEEVDTDY